MQKPFKLDVCHHDAAPPLDQFRKQAELEIFKSFMAESSLRGESLDIGTATGRYLLATHDLGLQAWGIDVNPVAVSLTREKLRDKGLPPYRAMEADVLWLPFADRRFCLITCMMGTIHHCANMDAAIREMARVLAPGGWLLISAVTKMDEKSDFLTLSPAHAWEVLAQRVRAGHTQIRSILHEHGLDLAFVWPGSACPDWMELPARTQRTSQMGEVAKAVDLGGCRHCRNHAGYGIEF